jgi:hypothetical protein
VFAQNIASNVFISTLFSLVLMVVGMIKLHYMYTSTYTIARIDICNCIVMNFLYVVVYSGFGTYNNQPV